MTEQRPIGYWLKLVDRLIDEQFAETLEEHGVTRRQWQLLNVLSRGPATVGELDAAIAPFLTASDGKTAVESSVDHLTELIDSGWVDATRDAYETTERGRTAFERLSEVVAQQRTTMTSRVSDDEYRTTVSALERMAANLGWTES